MQRLHCVLVTLAWGLWFGGIILVFVAIRSLFATFAAADQRPQFAAAAAGVFERFEAFQLALAAVVLLATLGWQTLAGRSRARTALLVLFAIATLLAIGETTVVAPAINRLRAAGEAGTPRFAAWHGASMVLYVGEAVLLFFAGAILPAAIAHRDAPATLADEEVPAPTADSPAAESVPAIGRQSVHT